MRKLSLSLILIAGFFGVWSCSAAEERPATTDTSAAALSAAPSSEDVVATITTLERDWVAAIVKKDVPVLERLLADDFNGTSPTAHTFTKKQAIADLTSGEYVVDAMDLDEITVNVYGDTAVSFTSQEETSKYFGNDTSGHYHFTDVWIRNGGQWRVVASHGSRYDKPHAAERS
jgi:ketosteroid isomerase-like protein